MNSNLFNKTHVIEKSKLFNTHVNAKYFNSLSNDITTLNISGKGITSLPDLTRFKNLKVLDCSCNKLTSLPTLPENLTELYCSFNQLASLPELNENLEVLICYNNQLTSLPELNKNLEYLDCSCNKLTSLPLLNGKLIELYCHKNHLSYLPYLNENVNNFICYSNPIYDLLISIVGSEFEDEIEFEDILNKLKNLFNMLNKFRDFYYSSKFKKQFIKWLWKSKEKQIAEKYHPKYLLDNLEYNTDLDEFLNNW